MTIAQIRDFEKWAEGTITDVGESVNYMPSAETATQKIINNKIGNVLQLPQPSKITIPYLPESQTFPLNELKLEYADLSNTKELFALYQEVSLKNVEDLATKMGLVCIPNTLEEMEIWIQERKILVAKTPTGKIVGLGEYTHIGAGINADELKEFIDSTYGWETNKPFEKILKTPENSNKIAIFERIGVAPEYLTSGLAGIISRSVESEMNKLGLEYMIGIILVRPINNPSLNFHLRSRGFRTVANLDKRREETSVKSALTDYSTVSFAVVYKETTSQPT